MNHDRRARHRAVGAALGALGDRELIDRLAAATPLGAGIGGQTARLTVDGVPVFVKRVPLTDLERRPEHVGNTGNLFRLPDFYQYGVGSAGFGAWRELAAHEASTAWVLDGESEQFPMLYHWRVLPHPSPSAPPAPSAPLAPSAPPAPSVTPVPSVTTAPAVTATPAVTAVTAGPAEAIDVSVAYWDGSAAVRERLEALASASASVLLFLEYLPQTLHEWLLERFDEGDASAAEAVALADRELHRGTRFMQDQRMIHFDAHPGNILTDGRRLYFADLGLAVLSGFARTPAEVDFLARHRDFDRYDVERYLVNWLCRRLQPDADREALIRACVAGTPSTGLPGYAVDVIARYGRRTLVLNAFWHRLVTGSKSTPYPPAADPHPVPATRP